MNTTITPTPYHSKAFTFRTLVVSLGLFLAWPVISTAQELFILSTESGVELYQVEKIRELDLRINFFHSSDPSYQGSASEIMMESLMVNSGLQKTPHGRLLTMTTSHVSLPTPKMDALFTDILTGDLPDQGHEDFGKESLALRVHETEMSSPTE